MRCDAHCSSSSTQALRVVRGTHDLLPETLRKYDAISSLLVSNAKRMGFSEIRTPVLESVAVFQRSLGLHSDVVSKEMFVVQSGTGVADTCLRPEATAGKINVVSYVQWRNWGGTWVRLGCDAW